MKPDPWPHLRDNARARHRAGLRRTLRARSHDELSVDLSSNDYLSLTRDPRVVDGAMAAIERWGTSAGASRLVAGSTTLHHEFEDALARHVGTPAALVFSSGYLANLGAIISLTDPDTLIVSDAHNHASLIDGCRLSRAQTKIVPHRDLDAIETALARRTTERALVLTESVFSVDGDAADLEHVHRIARAQGAVLLVDEAHSLGVVGAIGQGSSHRAGIAAETDVVITATLSKAFAAQGGVVLGAQDVVDHVIDSARTFIFDTGLAPAAVGAADAVLTILAAGSPRPSRVRRVARHIHAAAQLGGWTTPAPDAAIISLLVGEPDAAVAEQARWRDAGLEPGVFRPPSVPDGRSRLRLTAHAGVTEPELDQILTMVRER